MKIICGPNASIRSIPHEAAWPEPLELVAANDADGNEDFEADSLEAMLLDGRYDQLLEGFRRDLDAAEAALREYLDTLAGSEPP